MYNEILFRVDKNLSVLMEKDGEVGKPSLRESKAGLSRFLQGREQGRNRVIFESLASNTVRTPGSSCVLGDFRRVI